MIEAPHLHTPEAEARVRLQHSLQRVHLMENNDFEASAVEQIIADMNAGKISPQEADKKANAIIEAKNDR